MSGKRLVAKKPKLDPWQIIENMAEFGFSFQMAHYAKPDAEGNTWFADFWKIDSTTRAHGTVEDISASLAIQRSAELAREMEQVGGKP